MSAFIELKGMLFNLDSVISITKDDVDELKILTSDGRELK